MVADTRKVVYGGELLVLCFLSLLTLQFLLMLDFVFCRILAAGLIKTGI